MAAQKTSPAKALTVVALVIMAFFGVMWWREVYSNPQRVFDAMLDNSLRLSSVSKEATSAGQNQSAKDIVQLQFGAESRVRSITVLVQAGDKPATVISENVGTPAADYTRYRSIETSETTPKGKPLNFDGIIGVWGSNKVGGNATGGLIYDEAVLGIVPFGVPAKAGRRALLDLMKSENIYEITSVERTLQAGRPRYIYSLTVDASAYVKLLKRFGELHGLSHLSTLDPASYNGQSRLPFKLGVDVWSRQLKQIDYADSGRTEIFSGHNGRYDIDVPAETISIEELQLRLQKLQQ